MLGVIIMQFIQDTEAKWNDEKKVIFDEVESGTFDFYEVALNAPLPFEWWKIIDDNGITMGFGWINFEENDFEISFVVKNEFRKNSVGSIIVKELEELAIQRGVSHVLAIVKSSNPNSSKMIKWLYERDYFYYFPEIYGKMEMKSLDFTIRMAQKSDVHLMKEVIDPSDE